MDLVDDLLFGATDSQESINALWQGGANNMQMLHIADSEYESDSDLLDFPYENRSSVIARLEKMLEIIVDGLLEGSEPLTFTLKSRANISRRRSSHPETIPAPRVRRISFPGSTAQEAWKFTVLLRIIELIHRGLADNTVMTKRDLYYRHPELFVKQAVVDRYVDDLACTLGVSRSQLNVGMLVPKITDTDEINMARVRWILVIEKEATFRSLISATQWSEFSERGLVLTAKGYPDLATRVFLRQLNNCAPHVPMYAFVDLDPDGIAIMSTFKYGSYRLAHEDHIASDNTQALSLPSIRYLGMRIQHISRAQMEQHDADRGAVPELHGLMRLTARDRTKAVRMLEWDLCSETGLEQDWRHELQSMLMLNVKAEMQILDELPGGLVPFLCLELGRLEQAQVDVEEATTCSDDCLLF
ncbi:type IIb DNA topoisomerase [Stagonosporopsis vannaccii]|nr:type IIb DNA topoisomerase [Stagonosporopsis vannaccii]